MRPSTPLLASSQEGSSLTAIPKCTFHPGRDSVIQIAGRNYCAPCQQGIAAARSHVPQHVEPKDCFVWYASGDNWNPISGTGCAHWVAHQLNIRASGSGGGCLAGFIYRVRSLVACRVEVKLTDVQVNDIYVTPKMDHTGLVVQVTPTILIRHDSSGQGKVAENEFTTYFHGEGRFFR